MKEDIKMLEQESVVAQAQQDLRDLEKIDTDNPTETDKQMQDFEDGVITADQLAQIRSLYGYRRVKQQVRSREKIGRNDLCPCGSGKKYKKCCMASGKYEGYEDAER